MDDSKNYHFAPEIHIEMWKHYDKLRQEKISAFLTANSILAAIAGLSFTRVLELIAAISFLGIVVCISWFLLLTRSAAYIEYHRKKAGGNIDDFWKPDSWTPRSKNLDRTLPVAFFLFWVAVLSWSIVGR